MTDTRPPDPPPSPSAPPEIFRAAVESLTGTTVRPEVVVEPLRPPQRLAPVELRAERRHPSADGVDLASGRLVLLHDPDGHEAWDGVLRLVAYASAELDEQMGVDPMLPTVGLELAHRRARRARRAAYRAAGGTVTQTTSTRFGDLAGPDDHGVDGAARVVDGRHADLGPHLLAFVDLLCTAAGLPPEGVTVLSPADPPPRVTSDRRRASARPADVRLPDPGPTPRRTR